MMLFIQFFKFFDYIVYLDALRVNSRQNGKNENKALYLALGINMDGKKEVLGFYLSET